MLYILLKASSLETLSLLLVTIVTLGATLTLVITDLVVGILSRNLILEGITGFIVVFNVRGVFGAFITFNVIVVAVVAFKVGFLAREGFLVVVLLALALEARLGPILTRTTSYSMC